MLYITKAGLLLCLRMKKKMFIVGSLAILFALNVSGCSFLFDALNSGDSTSENSSSSGNNSSGQNGSPTIDTWDVEPKRLNVSNRVTHFKVNDIYVMPDVFLEDEEGNISPITNSVIATETEPNSKTDYSKKIDIDMSTPTGSSGKTIYIAYQCYFNNGKYVLWKEYTIRITHRNDSHFDPAEDLEIQTLELSDVYTRNQ